jgi:hypothetical protein
MPVAAYVKIPAAIEDIVEAGNSGTDQWAIALTNTVPGSKTFVAGTTDLATGGGYTAGGANVTTTSSGMNASDFVLVLADPTAWTGTGGGFTCRYALLVNKTLNVIPGYWDYGSSQVIAAGEQFVADLDQTATVGVYKIT